MKALLLREYGRLEYVDFPDPVPGPGEVVLGVKAVGICGSDVHGATGQSGRRIPPIVMGHEAAGEVVEPLRGGRFQKGDRLAVDSTLFCGRCGFCRQGRVNLCDERRVLGVSCPEYRQDGAMAQYMVLPERVLHRIPEDVGYPAACLVEPAAVALHALERSALSKDSAILVVGAGPIGLLLVQLAKAKGIRRVLVMDLDSNRLELARCLGADEGINPGAGDPLQGLLESNQGEKVDASFEAVGLEKTLETAIRCVKKGGSVTLVGNLSPESKIPHQWVVSHEISLHGSCAASREIPEVIRLMASKKIRADRLISKKAPLSEGNQWFQKLIQKSEEHLVKVILEP